MNTYALRSAANDDARARHDGRRCLLRLVSAELLDSPVSNNSLAGDLERLGKNFVGARPGSDGFASNVSQGTLDVLVRSAFRISAVSELLDAPVSNNSAISGLRRSGKTL